MKEKRNFYFSLLILSVLLILTGCGQNVESADNGEVTGALTSITISSGTLSPSFLPSVKEYSASVGNSVSSITVTAAGSGMIRVNDVAVSSGKPTSPISLSVGSNIITVKVTPTGSTTSQVYTLTIVRANTGNIYYVSTTGSDSNTGVSKDQAFKTPSYGAAQLEAGDTLIILGGKYVLADFGNDIITPSKSGTAGSPIIIRGEAGNRPVLAGRSNLGFAINLSGLKYIRLENLEITHDPSASGSAQHFRDGIVIAGQPASNIVLQDLYIHHLDEFGMNFQDINNLEVKNCTIEYCGFGAIGGPAAGSGGGMKNIVIDNCDLSYGGHYYQGGDGSSRPYDRPDGFGNEESVGPIEIKNTLAEHNYGDGLDSKSQNTYIHDSIVANNSCDGVKLWGGGSKIKNTLIYGTGDGVGGGSPWSGIVIDTTNTNASFEIINVTVHDNPQRQNYIMYVQYDNPNVAINLTLRNTILANSYGQAYFAPGVKLTADHNIFYRPGDDIQVTANNQDYTSSNLSSLGSGNIYGDPKFVKPAWGTTGDYHLQTGSPAIDAGSSTGAPSADLDGKSRPQGKGVDIGAYEQ